MDPFPVRGRKGRSIIMLDAKLIWTIVLALNGLTLLVFGLGKLFARGKRSRVPEAVLLLLCVLGGSAGGLVGMSLFRHKVNYGRHPGFVLGVPLIFWAQTVFGAIAAWKWG